MNQNQTQSKPASVEESREEGLDATACSPFFRAELERIANDYTPESDEQAPLALSEMREALHSLLANAEAHSRRDENPNKQQPFNAVE